MAETILRVEDLTKYFGGLRAVHLNLTVMAGELHCLIGPNGAGKSTFFHVLTGRLPADAGKIFFREQEITGWDTFRIARLGVSIKFQVASVFDALSVLQNLLTAAEFRYGYREGLARAHRMLAVIGLEARRNTPAAQLSHGEKQWLEIGMASIAEPVLLLLDEPTAGMTIQEVHQTVQLLRHLNEHATMIVVEHDMNFIRMIARQVTVMHEGEVFAQGPMEAIEANEAVRDIYLGKGKHDALRT
jgi:ABC-type uncharacterized transport system ATPase subunit